MYSAIMQRNPITSSICKIGSAVRRMGRARADPADGKRQAQTRQVLRGARARGRVDTAQGANEVFVALRAAGRCRLFGTTPAQNFAATSPANRGGRRAAASDL